MGHVTGLRCKGCGKEFEKKPVAACEECWAALEPIYDLDGIRRTFTRESIAMLAPEPPSEMLSCASFSPHSVDALAGARAG